MIEVRNLSKSYGDRPAISALNFSVRKGEVVGFLGPNGAGKSTTMKIITGYMAPSSGEVKVAGYDVFEDPIEVKRRIGYLPETPPVYHDMYVGDYLRFVANLKGVEKSRVTSLVNASLEKTGLQDVRGRLIGNLSKGYKQRVGLAQSLVSDPEVLILDEPTVGLDPKQVAEMRQLIRQLKGQHTLILSTHILPEVQASCEKVIIINRGSIVAEDSLEGLSKRMSGGGHSITVRVRRNQDAVVKGLGVVEGVTKAVNMGNFLEVETDGSEATVERVAGYVVGQGAGLLELRVQALALEDIFIKLTSNAEAVQ
ncbi:MAG: ATP-binding cassette domain-containing protein [Calothrix sp. SM1_5_4]|nr:ATP-binding cassette domain-containing protein [Calothrix sp. SM1_5_4]